jgi:hypothetical protein
MAHPRVCRWWWWWWFTLANLNYLGRKEEVIGIKLGELPGNF